jgi:hypothetical protein
MKCFGYDNMACTIKHYGYVKYGKWTSKLVFYCNCQSLTLAVDKHTSLLRNPYITNLQCLIVYEPHSQHFFSLLTYEWAY